MAFAELLSWQTLGAPVESFGKFWGEFAMVAECCTERSWLAGMQPHLVHYVPQAVPFFSWVAWPPFFDHPFYSILPIIALPAFIFYDALAGFNGEPAASHAPPPPLPPPPPLVGMLSGTGGPPPSARAISAQSPHNLPTTLPAVDPRPFDLQARRVTPWVRARRARPSRS